jgi:hypothetical protein
MQVSILPSLPLTFLLLLLAHLLGDFVLQPSGWVRKKSRLGLKAPAFWWHILLHGLLSWIFIARKDFWPWAIAIIILHGAVDQLKCSMENKTRRHTAAYQRRWFWWDQLLHVILLAIVAITWQAAQYAAVGNGAGLVFQQIKQSLTDWWTPDHILLITMIIFLTRPSAIIIRMLITGWTPAYNNQLETDSLKNAGTYIGMLERLFVFTFLICGHFEAVGFLLAAKSIFRFGDLKAARDRKLTEYVLIGTLLSFGLAIIAALIYSHGILV